MDEADELQDRDDQPCPVGNRWGPEITRLDVEIRSLRHRSANTEQIITNQGAILKSFNDQLERINGTLYGPTGLEIAVDRLIQAKLTDKESRALVDAAHTLRNNSLASWSAAGGVFVIVMLWVIDKVWSMVAG